MNPARPIERDTIEALHGHCLMYIALYIRRAFVYSSLYINCLRDTSWTPRLPNCAIRPKPSSMRLRKGIQCGSFAAAKRSRGLCRLRRERRLSRAKYQVLKQTLLGDLAGADLCELTTAVMRGVIRLLESNPLGAMDAIHVASAAAYGAELFASADLRQLAAARKLRLRVVDVS